jgi:predicted amidohydrolase YtcJ
VRRPLPQRSRSRLSGLLALLLAAPAGSALDAPVDLLLTHARIYTVNPAQPWAEAVAIKDGRVVYVGDEAGAKAWAGPLTRRHDLGGRLVLPALVDSHTHPGQVASSADFFLLPETLDREALVRAVAEHARANPGKALLVGGYWPIAAFGLDGPRKQDLDRAVPDRPVILFDDSGHSQWLNSTALRRMKVTRDTPDPVPGLSCFARDADGEPTGWAKESALEPFLGGLGFRSVVDKNELAAFLQYLVSKGVTLLFDAGNGRNDQQVYEALAELEAQGRLPLRYQGCVHVTLPDQMPEAIPRLRELRRRFAGPRLRFDTVKIHFDGVSEIGTSSVLEPFQDPARSRGGTVISGDRLRDFILRLQPEGIDLHLHTVGDAATRTALDAVEQARGALGGRLDVRVTLCHLELLDAADIPRFKALGVLANATPHWNGGYFQGADRWLGQARYDRMYRVQPLLDAGASVSFSSDITDHIEWKTDRADPFLGMQIGHTRQEPDGGPRAPVRPPEDERLRLEDVVRGYTLAGARQLRRESELGSIEVGKSADLVMLAKNLFEVERYAIRSVAPEAVLMEGRVVSGRLP